ncbi:hypothetical protein ACVWYF_000193 [Hymenobacter sp. UYAg731]
MIPISFGILVISLAVWAFYNENQRKQKLRSSGTQVSGIVVRNQVCWGRNTVVRPIVRFQLTSGTTIELLDKNGTAFLFPRYKKGEQVKLIYEPGNPNNFSILG